MTCSSTTTKRVALYARTVADAAPTIDDQLELLHEVAAHQGWTITAIHTDIGAGGFRTRNRVPGLDALLRQVRSSPLDLIATHSLDRLGRSLSDLVRTLGELRAHGVNLYVHEQAIDTATPSGHTLFETVGIFVQYERALARERIIAGQRRAVLNGMRIGRPPLPTSILRHVRAALDAGRGVRETARLYGVSPTAVHRIKGEIADRPARDDGQR